MRVIIFCLVFSVFLQDNVPLLSADEFTYEVEYFLKQKQKNTSTVYEANKSSESSVQMLPYVRINFSFLSFQESDKKIRVFQGDKLLNTRRIKGPMKLGLEMGYTEDLKEGILPPVFEVLILNDDKETRAKIKVEVRPNGELLINEVVSGMI